SKELNSRENNESIDATQHENQSGIKSSLFRPLRKLYIHLSNSLFRKMLWNILLLALSWSLGQGIFFIQISITTLAATSFTNWYLATIPIGSMLFVATVWSVFLPRVILHCGYRPPFYFGALMGMIGAGLCIVATWFKLYWLLIVSATFIGGQVPCTFYYRLAGLQFSTQEFASKAIAMVTAGGCLSAFIGPEIAKLMINALPKQYSGAYLAALCECAVLLFIIRIIQFPDVKRTHNSIESISLPTSMDTNLSSNGRSILTIVRQRTFVIAAFGGFVSWSAMGIQMSSAALAMIGSGHTFTQVITAVEYHILGMFLPSFFTGTLCNWFGSRLVMLTGLLIQFVGTFLFQCGFEIIYFDMGLIIVGIGWNLGYVGSSVLFTKSYCPEEKMKAHSLYEAILMFSISISFFSSAFAEQFLGWKTLTGMLIRIYMAAAVLIVAVDTAFVFYKTKNIRIEITCNDKQVKTQELNIQVCSELHVR
ncbi:unnamed protein product, partial [Rotaria sp. Silwood2]